MQKLTDGEIASNNGGWGWSAGTGADAAPYFRILNPWTQTARHDPEGDYIKKWIPELRDVPPEKLAEPPGLGQRLAKKLPRADRRSCTSSREGAGTLWPLQDNDGRHGPKSAAPWVGKA